MKQRMNLRLAMLLMMCLSLMNGCTYEKVTIELSTAGKEQTDALHLIAA